MKLFAIFLIVFTISFIPIPIKLNIFFSPQDFYIKLYGFTIMSKKKFQNKTTDKTKLSEDNDGRKNLQKSKKDKNFIGNLFKKIDIKKLISKLYNSHFKPSLKLKLNLDYSLNDAAKTAIFFGILSNFPSFTCLLCKIIFNVRKYTFDINPKFEDKFLLNFETSSIIFLSLAHIINILIILFKSITHIREVNPL